MDTISQLMDLARVQARLDKRCLLAGATVMDVQAYGDAQAAFHFLLEGECTLEVGGKSLTLKAGDAVLLPSSPPHRIRTAGAGRVQGTVEAQGDFFDTIRSDSAGDGVIDLFCGHYTFGSRSGVLLVRSLPDPLVVSFGEGGDMVRTMSGLMRQEALAEGPGTSAILSSICTALVPGPSARASWRISPLILRTVSLPSPNDTTSGSGRLRTSSTPAREPKV